MCPRCVDSELRLCCTENVFITANRLEGFLCFCEGFLSVGSWVWNMIVIKLLSNQDVAWVCEQWHFFWKIQYFGPFNINLISLHSICEILNQINLTVVLKSWGKVEINVKNATVQDFCRKFPTIFRTERRLYLKMIRNFSMITKFRTKQSNHNIHSDNIRDRQR